jgi:hypothetical protein
MNILRRFLSWYARVVRYESRPCPFSGSSPKIQSTVRPGGDQ